MEEDLESIEVIIIFRDRELVNDSFSLLILFLFIIISMIELDEFSVFLIGVISMANFKEDLL